MEKELERSSEKKKVWALWWMWWGPSLLSAPLYKWPSAPFLPPPHLLPASHTFTAHHVSAKRLLPLARTAPGEEMGRARAHELLTTAAPMGLAGCIVAVHDRSAHPQATQGPAGLWCIIHAHACYVFVQMLPMYSPCKYGHVHLFLLRVRSTVVLCSL